MSSAFLTISVYHLAKSTSREVISCTSLSSFFMSFQHSCRKRGGTCLHLFPVFIQLIILDIFVSDKRNPSKTSASFALCLPSPPLLAAPHRPRPVFLFCPAKGTGGPGAFSSRPPSVSALMAFLLFLCFKTDIIISAFFVVQIPFAREVTSHAPPATPASGKRLQHARPGRLRRGRRYDGLRPAVARRPAGGAARQGHRRRPCGRRAHRHRPARGPTNACACRAPF